MGLDWAVEDAAWGAFLQEMKTEPFMISSYGIPWSMDNGSTEESLAGVTGL